MQDQNKSLRRALQDGIDQLDTHHDVVRTNKADYLPQTRMIQARRVKESVSGLLTVYDTLERISQRWLYQSSTSSATEYRVGSDVHVAPLSPRFKDVLDSVMIACGPASVDGTVVNEGFIRYLAQEDVTVGREDSTNAIEESMGGNPVIEGLMDELRGPLDRSYERIRSGTNPEDPFFVSNMLDVQYDVPSHYDNVRKLRR